MFANVSNPQTLKLLDERPDATSYSTPFLPPLNNKLSIFQFLVIIIVNLSTCKK